MNKFYTGIGSRDLPPHYQTIITQTATWLANKNYILRSGGASGSDLAFEQGCDIGKGSKQIFIPWRNFNDSTSQLFLPYEYQYTNAYKIAKKYHPNFDNLSNGAKKLHTRNTYQILGANLDSPSSFVFCYTPNGSRTGGTGQALRIATDYNIPVFDFGAYKTLQECRIAFREFVNKYID